MSLLLRQCWRADPQAYLCVDHSSGTRRQRAPKPRHDSCRDASRQPERAAEGRRADRRVASARTSLPPLNSASIVRTLDDVRARQQEAVGGDHGRSPGADRVASPSASSPPSAAPSAMRTIVAEYASKARESLMPMVPFRRKFGDAIGGGIFCDPSAPSTGRGR